jgi:hypothetical protein
MGKQFVSRKIEDQRKEAEQRSQKIRRGLEEDKKKKHGRKLLVLLIISAVVVIGAVYGLISALSPGRYDEFAKCLTAKGAIIYGAEWCHYTSAQKAMFGKSFRYINYKLYDARPDIKVTPTWEINGQLYERVQSFEKLASLTGCGLP